MRIRWLIMAKALNWAGSIYARGTVIFRFDSIFQQMHERRTENKSSKMASQNNELCK